MAYNIDPNAKNIWIRDPNNTEDLSPQTHTSAVYLDNGHTIEDELGKAKSLTDTLEANESINRITEDTYESPYYEAKLKGQTVVNLIQDEIDLKDDKEYTIPYTYDKSEAVNISNTSDAGTMHPILEGQTLINYIQDPSKDAVVIPYQVPEVNEYRIDNTKTNGALDLKMYGRTLQNLIEFDNIKTEVTSNEHVTIENNIIKFTGLAGSTLNITFGSNLTKPNNKYTFIVELNKDIPESRSITLGFLFNTETWNSYKYTNATNSNKLIFNNRKAVFTLNTTSNYNNYGIRIRYDNREGYTETENLPIEVKIVLLEGDYRNNICPAGFIDKGYYNSNNITSSNYDVTTDFIKVKPNTSYAAKFFKSPNFDYHFSSIDKDGLLVQYAFFDENKNFISRCSSTGIANIYNTNILTPENCYYIKLWFAINENSSPGALIENNCVLIETTDLPSTITEYIPYNINENIPFFTGISHVTNPELKVTGQNLCSGFINNGYISIDGIYASSSSNIMTDFIKVKPNTSYAARLFPQSNAVLSYPYGEYMQRAFFDKNKNYLGRHAYGDSTADKTFTTPDNCYYIKIWQYIQVNASLTENKCVLLETTANPSTITSYIPYTENKLDYNHISLSKNLFNQNRLEYGNISTSTGLNIINNTSETDSFFRTMDFIEVKSSTSYILSFNGIVTSNGRYFFYDANKNFIGHDLVPSTGIITTSDSCKYIRFRFSLASNGLDYNTVTDPKEFLNLPSVNNKIQLEEGTTVTLFVPYEVFELRSLPNTDIRDEINLKTNTLTRNIKKIVLDGSDDERWYLSNNIDCTGQTTISFQKNFSDYNYSRSYIICNIYSNNFLVMNKGTSMSELYEDKEWIRSYSSTSGNIGVRILRSKLETEDINGFKSYLSKNPITLYYELKTPEVTTLAPSILDQDSNKLTKISPYNTNTYLSTFKENEVIPTIESFNPVYNVLLMPNTTYTLNLTNTAYRSDTTSFNFKINNSYYTLNKVANTVYADPKLVFTTGDTISDSKLEFIGHGQAINNIMLLKGDYSSKTIPTNYIEGVGSSIPKTITVHNKNLFNHDVYLNINNFNTYKWDGITINGNSISGNIPANSYYAETKLFDNVLERNTTYTFSADCVNCVSTILFYTISNSVYSFIMEKNVTPSNSSISFTTPDCSFYVQFRYLRRNTGIGIEVENASVSNIQIEKGDTKTDYTAYSYSKYTLPDNLKLNSALWYDGQSIMSDTYDVYSGKKIQNVYPFCIDGISSVTINKYADNENYPDVSGFYVVLPRRARYSVADLNNAFIYSKSTLNNDIITNTASFPESIATNIEACNISDAAYFKFTIKKSKLETDDVAGVRKYLSENPIYYYYSLAEPITTYLENSQEVKAKSTITNMTTLLKDGNIKPLMGRRNTNSYNVLLKPGYEYTIALNKKRKATDNNISFNLGGAVATCSVNNRFVVVTTPDPLTNNTLTIDNGIGVGISNPMVLRGYGYNSDLPFVEGMVDVVAPKIRTVGENLFNINGNINEKYNGILGSNNILKNNKIISNSCFAYHHGLGQKIKVQPGKKYLISYKKNNVAASEIHLKNSINRWIQYADNNTTLNKIITIPHFCNEILISFNSGSDTVKGEFWDVCIKQCDDIEDISSYKYMQNTLYTPDTLHLRSLSNGIYDELDVNTGKLTQKIKKVVLTGADDEKWYLDTTKTVTQVFEYIAKDAVANPLYIRCDKLPRKENWEGDNEKITIARANRTASDGLYHTAIYIALNKTKASTVDELRSYLASNPITVYYMLKEPIISYIDTSTVSLGEIKVGHVLGNNVADSYNPSTNIYTRRVGYIHLDGSEEWMTGGWGNQINTIGFEFKLAHYVNANNIFYYTENNYFSYYPHDGISHAGFDIDKEGINIIDHVNGLLMRIRILRSKLVTEDIEGFKAWLAENPQDCYYEMVLPEILNKKPSDISNEKYIGKSHPFAYKNGHIILESNHDGYSLYPSLEYKLVGNRQGQIEQTAKLIREHEVKLSTLEQMLVKQIIEISYNNSILKLNIEGDE